jgi:hypothetical protein
MLAMLHGNALKILSDGHIKNGQLRQVIIPGVSFLSRQSRRKDPFAKFQPWRKMRVKYDNGMSNKI